MRDDEDDCPCTRRRRRRPAVEFARRAARSEPGRARNRRTNFAHKDHDTRRVGRLGPLRRQNLIARLLSLFLVACCACDAPLPRYIQLSRFCSMPIEGQWYQSRDSLLHFWQRPEGSHVQQASPITPMMLRHRTVVSSSYTSLRRQASVELTRNVPCRQIISNPAARIEPSWVFTMIETPPCAFCVARFGRRRM